MARHDHGLPPAPHWSRPISSVAPWGSLASGGRLPSRRNPVGCLLPRLAPTDGRLEGSLVFHCLRDMKLVIHLLGLAFTTVVFAAPVTKISDFELADQEAKPRRYRFPKS